MGIFMIIIVSIVERPELVYRYLFYMRDWNFILILLTFGKRSNVPHRCGEM